MNKKFSLFWLTALLVTVLVVAFSPPGILYTGSFVDDGSGRTVIPVTGLSTAGAVNGNVPTYNNGWTLSTPSGAGTVTSVSGAGDGTIFASGAYGVVTASGTLTLPTPQNQNANLIFAGPGTGSAAAPAFRSLVSADIPSLSSIYQPLAAPLTTLSGNAPANTVYANSTASAATRADTGNVTLSNLVALANVYAGGFHSTNGITNDSWTVSEPLVTDANNRAVSMSYANLLNALFATLGNGPGVPTNSSSTSTPSWSWTQIGGGGGGSWIPTLNGLGTNLTLTGLTTWTNSTGKMLSVSNTTPAISTSTTGSMWGPFLFYGNGWNSGSSFSEPIGWSISGSNTIGNPPQSFIYVSNNINGGPWALVMTLGGTVASGNASLIMPNGITANQLTGSLFGNAQGFGMHLFNSPLIATFQGGSLYAGVIIGATNGFVSFATNVLSPVANAWSTTVSTLNAGYTNAGNGYPAMYFDLQGTSCTAILWARGGLNGTSICAAPIITNTFTGLWSHPLGTNCGVQVVSGTGIYLTVGSSTL